MPSLPVTDIHLHVTAYRSSGADPLMTVAACLERCRALRIGAVGLVEHLNGTAKHPITCMQAMLRELRAMATPAAMDVRAGAELDIVDDRGTLRLDPAAIGELKLDYLIASVHGMSKSVPADASLEDVIRGETQWMVAAVERNDAMDVLGHPWSISRKRESWDFSAVPADCRERLVEALSRRGKALNVTHRELKDREVPEFGRFVNRCVQAGVKLAVGSDAHSLDAIDVALRLTAWLESTGVRAGDLYWPAPR